MPFVALSSNVSIPVEKLMTKHCLFSALALFPKYKAIALAIFSGVPFIEPLVSIHKIIGPSLSFSFVSISVVILSFSS